MRGVLSEAAEAYIKNIDTEIFCDGCPKQINCPIEQNLLEYSDCYRIATLEEIVALLQEADQLWE